MIIEFKNLSIDIILIKSINRFGCYTQEFLEFIRKIRIAGKRNIFLRDKIDTETMDNELLINVIQTSEQSEK